MLQKSFIQTQTASLLMSCLQENEIMPYRSDNMNRSIHFGREFQ